MVSYHIYKIIKPMNSYTHFYMEKMSPLGGWEWGKEGT